MSEDEQRTGRADEGEDEVKAHLRRENDEGTEDEVKGHVKGAGAARRQDGEDGGDDDVEGHVKAARQ